MSDPAEDTPSSDQLAASARGPAERSVADWLDLIDRRSREDFTPDELDHLARQARRSPELAAAIAARLRLEATLAAAMADRALPLEQLLSEARRRRARRSWPLWVGGTVAAALLVIGGVGLVTVWQAADDDRLVAQQDRPGDASPTPSPPDAGTNNGPMESDGSVRSDATSDSTGPEEPSRAPVVPSEGAARRNETESGLPPEPAAGPPGAEGQAAPPVANGPTIEDAGANADASPSAIGEPSADSMARDRQPADAMANTAPEIAGQDAGRDAAQIANQDRAAGRGGPMGDDPPSSQPPRQAPPPVPRLWTDADRLAPWFTTVTDEGPRTPFPAVVFPTGPRDRPPISEADVRRFLEPVEGKPNKIETKKRDQRTLTQFQGTFRLTMPWTEDVALRVAFEQIGGVKLHFLTGDRTATIIVTDVDNRGRVAGYVGPRPKPGEMPAELVLASHDDFRAVQTGVRQGGVLTFWPRGGRLLVTQGDILLNDVPFPGLPEEVLIEGTAQVPILEAIRSEPPVGLAGLGDVPAGVRRAAPRGDDDARLANDNPAKETPPRDDPAERGVPVAPAFFGPDGRLRLVPDEEAPPPGPTPIDVTADGWNTERLGKATLTDGPDGSLILDAKNASEKGYAFRPLPRTVLSNVVLEIENPTAGAGIFLSTDRDPNFGVLKFMENSRDGRLVLTHADNNDEWRKDFGDLDKRVVPVVGSRCFVRLVFSGGNFHTAVSPDGQSWAPIGRPRRFWHHTARNLGVFHVARRPDCGLTIRSGHLEPWPEMARLITAVGDVTEADAPGTFPSGTPTPGHASDRTWDQRIGIITDDRPGRWWAVARAARPADVPMNDHLLTAWQRFLALGMGESMVARSAPWLLDSIAWESLSPDRHRRLLDEFAALAVYGDQEWRRFTPYYLAWASRPDHADGQTASSRFRQACLTAPVLADWPQPLLDHETFRRDMLAALTTGQLEQADRLVAEFQSFQIESGQSPLTDWAASRLALTRGEPLVDRSGSQKPDWDVVWREDVEKSAYNLLAQLTAALESDAPGDAARLLIDLPPRTTGGLTPIRDEAGLYLSAPVVIGWLYERFPALGDAVRSLYGEIAELRVRRAIESGSVAELRHLVTLLAPTPAAATAWETLGDADLAEGRFAQADEAYAAASETAGPVTRERLAGKRRLAAALDGRAFGKPLTGPLTLGGVTFAADQFEAMIADLVTSRSMPREDQAQPEARDDADAPPVREASPLTPGEGVPVVTLAPGSYALGPVRHGPLTGGSNPGDQQIPWLNDEQIPWALRRITVTPTRDGAFVSNQFTQRFLPADGSEPPSAVTQPVPPGKGREMALTPMRTVPVPGERPTDPPVGYLTRFLGANGPVLVGLKASRDAVAWTLRLPRGWTVASDPQIGPDGQAVVILAEAVEADETRLHLVTVAPDRGDILAERFLVQVTRAWRGRSVAELVAVDSGWLVNLGGVVAVVEPDELGLRWLRHDVTAPTAADRVGLHQHLQRPLVTDDRVILHNPGAIGLVCLATATGHTIWRYDEQTVLRTIAQVGSDWLVQTANGLVWLDAESGTVRRSVAWPRPIDALAVGPDQTVVLLDRVRHARRGDRWLAGLTWLDAVSGERVGATMIGQLADRERLGPFATLAGQTMLGRTENWERDQVEFRPLEPLSGDDAQNAPPPEVETMTRPAGKKGPFDENSLAPALEAAVFDPPSRIAAEQIQFRWRTHHDEWHASIPADRSDSDRGGAAGLAGPTPAEATPLWRLTSLHPETVEAAWEKPRPSDAVLLRANHDGPIVWEATAPHAATDLVIRYRNRTEHAWEATVWLDGRPSELARTPERSASDEIRTLRVPLGQAGERRDQAQAVVLLHPQHHSDPRDLEIVALVWE